MQLESKPSENIPPQRSVAAPESLAKASALSRRDFCKILGLFSAATAVPGLSWEVAKNPTALSYGTEEVAALFANLASPAGQAMKESLSLVSEVTKEALSLENDLSRLSEKALDFSDPQRQGWLKNKMLGLVARVVEAFEGSQQLPNPDLLHYATNVVGLEYLPGKFADATSPGTVFGELFWKGPQETEAEWERGVKEHLESQILGKKLDDYTTFLHSLREREKLLDLLVTKFPPLKTGPGYQFLVWNRPDLLLPDRSPTPAGLTWLARVNWRWMISQLGSTAMFAASKQSALTPLLQRVASLSSDPFVQKSSELILKGEIEAVGNLPVVKTMQEVEKLSHQVPACTGQMAKRASFEVQELKNKFTSAAQKLTAQGFSPPPRFTNCLNALEQEWQERLAEAKNCQPAATSTTAKNLSAAPSVRILAAANFNPPREWQFKNEGEVEIVPVKSWALYSSSDLQQNTKEIWWKLTTPSKESKLRKLPAEAVFAPELKNFSFPASGTATK